MELAVQSDVVTAIAIKAGMWFRRLSAIEIAKVVESRLRQALATVWEIARDLRGGFGVVADRQCFDIFLALGDGASEVLEACGVVRFSGNHALLPKTQETEKQEQQTEKFELVRTVGTKATLDVSHVLQAWNAAALQCGMHQCRSTTPKRTAAIKARAKDEYWRANYQAALNVIASGECRFASGNNDRNWRGNIDWFLRPDTVAKILEGQYSGRKSVTEIASESFAEIEQTGNLGIWGNVSELLTRVDRRMYSKKTATNTGK